MSQSFRITAKFNPIQEASHVKYTTESKIRTSHLHCRRIFWKRKFGETSQAMTHLDNCAIYQCSQLDAEFIIEAAFETGQTQEKIQKKILMFGPIERQGEDPIPSVNQFIIEMVTNSKIFNCILAIYQNQIQLKCKSPVNPAVYHISMQDIGNCYVGNLCEQTIIFPTLFQRIIGLKLFNQIILSGGNYSQNNDPLKIRIMNKKQFKSVLIKLNAMKIQRYRRGSQLSGFMCKKGQKPSIISTQAKKSLSDIKQDSEDSFKIIGKSKPNLQQLKNLKTSQLILTQKQSIVTSQNQHPNSLQGEQNNYLDEFQNLLFENDQKEEVLLLNSSFQELENNNGSEKDLQKLQYIKKKKQLAGKTEQQKLRIRLEELKKQRSELFHQNRKLKKEVDHLTNANRDSNPMMVATLKTQLKDLKKQIQKLQNQQLGNSKFLIKYKSQKQISGL